MKAGLLLTGLAVLLVGGLSLADNKPAGRKADNSAVNARDARPDEKTAEQAGSSKSDTDVTAEIRKQIMSQKDFSVYAQNVKIIVEKGHVTLKGPVRTKNESTTIQRIASEVAGATNVKNELELATGE